MAEKKYAIATIKSWNIERAEKFKDKTGLPIEVLKNPDELTLERINQINPRYIFFPHWSWRIPKEIYENWECVVFHMTDLPFGRGGSPLQNLIEMGIKQTKISAIKVVEEIDAGPIYLKSEPIALTGTAEEIFVRIADIIFNQMIPYIIEKEPIPQPQVGEPVVFKRRTPEQGNLANIKDLCKIYDYIRMLDAEGYPRAYLEFGNFRVEFSRAEISENCVKALAVIRPKECMKNE